LKSLNRVMLIGHLGSDPEVKNTQSGVVVCSLSLATSSSWKDKNTGVFQEKTEWHRVVLWRGLAEISQKYLKKGSKVYVEGELQTRKWTDSQGQEKYSTEVIGKELIMLGSEANKTNDSERPNVGGTPEHQGNAQFEETKDDLPF
jgi:single-strand DNA-binding protein